MDLVKFVGDVEATDTASVSTRSGSLVATLKKSFRQQLGDVIGGQLSSAVLSFGAGKGLVLLGSEVEAAARVRVSRVAANRFEITFDDGEDDVVDDLTVAFLTLKTQQFQAGALELRGPIAAADWGAEIDDAARRAAPADTEPADTGSVTGAG